MRKISAQYIITNSGPALKRGIISIEDDGTIVNIEDTGGNLEEAGSTEFYNGIIIPGFVNCHCHLELSHLKKRIPEGEGLSAFVEKVRSIRERDAVLISEAAAAADASMYTSGISLCADICNTSDTFGLKRESSIKYINLLEVFGIDPDRAEKRMNEILSVSALAREAGLISYLVPHASYSMSVKLLDLLRKHTGGNKVTSVHFMESRDEISFLSSHSGNLAASYERSGLLPGRLDTPPGHARMILDGITRSGNLILVHNTYADSETVRSVISRGSTFWCLCPGSNRYIENAVPPVRMLREEGCNIVIGTDSLSSNTRLDILSELILLQEDFPEIQLEEMIAWATRNGAEALGEQHSYGKLEKGMKPGIILLENADLHNMKLLPETTVTRLA